MLKLFLYLHLAGLLVLAAGVCLYVVQPETEGMSSMLMIASALGLGLMMISPYPVVKAIQWMMKQDEKEKQG